MADPKKKKAPSYSSAPSDIFSIANMTGGTEYFRLPKVDTAAQASILGEQVKALDPKDKEKGFKLYADIQKQFPNSMLEDIAFNKISGINLPRSSYSGSNAYNKGALYLSGMGKPLSPEDYEKLAEKSFDTTRTIYGDTTGVASSPKAALAGTAANKIGSNGLPYSTVKAGNKGYLAAQQQILNELIQKQSATGDNTLPDALVIDDILGSKTRAAMDYFEAKGLYKTPALFSAENVEKYKANVAAMNQGKPMPFPIKKGGNQSESLSASLPSFNFSKGLNNMLSMGKEALAPMFNNEITSALSDALGLDGLKDAIKTGIIPYMKLPEKLTPEMKRILGVNKPPTVNNLLSPYMYGINNKAPSNAPTVDKLLGTYMYGIDDKEKTDLLNPLSKALSEFTDKVGQTADIGANYLQRGLSKIPKPPKKSNEEYFKSQGYTKVDSKKIKVIDGDTVLYNGKVMRLSDYDGKSAYFDAAESSAKISSLDNNKYGQYYNTETGRKVNTSSEELQRLINSGKSVYIKLKDDKSYGRDIGMLYYQDPDSPEFYHSSDSAMVTAGEAMYGDYDKYPLTERQKRITKKAKKFKYADSPSQWRKSFKQNPFNPSVIKTN